MEFTIHYRGPLLGAQSDNRVKEKQKVRLALSPQLGEFWGRDPRFNFHDLNKLQIVNTKAGRIDIPRPIKGQEGFHYQYTLGGFCFIPLITKALEADCALNIRFHRPQDAGSIIYADGDLDNKLKVLFDALRIPREMTELGKSTPEQNSDNRVFCLLEDDGLITRLTIDSKRLLGPPREPNYVELEIDVTITAVTPMVGNIDLLYK